MRMRSCSRLQQLTTPFRNRLALVAAATLVTTGAHADDRWKVSGDLRVGYVASETRDRSGHDSDSDSLRARVRLGLSGDLGGGWHAKGRVAARLDTDQNDEEFWMRWYAPAPTGLENGQGTLDEAYLEYRPAEAPWSVRMGRFQAAWGLDDLMSKSLDQNDSPNFDIMWTDGVWLQWQPSKDWNTHVILRHNDRRGPTGALRQPLEFSDSDSRVSLFAAAESKTPMGPLVQRLITFNWLPSALHTYGIDDPRAEDYFAMTVKAVAQWPLGEGDTKLRLGGELGYAPDTPRREAVGSGSGSADSLSWQASLNFMDILPAHSLGIVYGRVADGWLLSSDFRPNDSLAEVRWAWKARKDLQFDARLRRRKEIDRPTATDARRDYDIYLRGTLRF